MDDIHGDALQGLTGTVLKTKPCHGRPKELPVDDFKRTRLVAVAGNLDHPDVGERDRVGKVDFPS